MYGFATDWNRSTWDPVGNLATHFFTKPINFNRIDILE